MKSNNPFVSCPLLPFVSCPCLISIRYSQRSSLQRKMRKYEIKTLKKNIQKYNFEVKQVFTHATFPATDPTVKHQLDTNRSPTD